MPIPQRSLRSNRSCPLVATLLLAATFWTVCATGLARLAADEPLAGQIIVDPADARWLVRHGEGHVFICGPGDPEGFLYRGERLADGTRRGDQSEIIDKLRRHGGNSLYLQVVRSHGGDGGADENPFVDSDPTRGLDEDILAQWDDWFAALDDAQILIYLFLYDDGSRPWNTGDEVHDEERDFVRTVVRRYQNLRNLIWIVAEEAEEAYSNNRVRTLAEVIAEADSRGHPIGAHHHSGTTFKSWVGGCALDHFAMQFNGDIEQAHAAAIEALRRANGRYQVIYAENTETPADIRQAWASAMGGLMPMLIGVDVATTPPALLAQCRHLTAFFEGTDFYRLASHDELARGGAQWVLARPPESFIAYGEMGADGLGIGQLRRGSYLLSWLDCASGARIDQRLWQDNDDDRVFPRPPGIGPHCAAWIRAYPLRSAAGTEVPGSSWTRRAPAESGLDPSRLEEAARLSGGRGCVVHDGYLVYEWGDSSRPGDLASASKPLYSHLLLAAISEGKLPSVDEPVHRYVPCVAELNIALGRKDRKLTFRHLAFQTACLGFREEPGTAYDYNDATMGFFWDALINQVYGVPWERALEDVFDSRLLAPLELEDGLTFPTSGRKRGRPSLSPRDFARFGLLYLRRGRWGDRQILPADLATMAVSDPLPLSVPRTREEAAEKCATRSIGGGANQTDHNGGYSWLWWINGIARDGRRWWPDAPPDLFAALGHCGMRGVAVLPDAKLVVSWNDARELHCDRELGNRFFRALLEAAREQ